MTKWDDPPSRRLLVTFSIPSEISNIAMANPAFGRFPIGKRVIGIETFVYSPFSFVHFEEVPFL